MVAILLALGSNLGNRAAALRAALAALAPQATVTGVSPIYETAPRYVTDQPAFLNMTAAAKTDLSPDSLINHLKAVEDAVGRRPGRRFGPRLIDLDILFYGDRVYATENLEIPHPRLADRAFVLEPLADLASAWIDPRDGRSVLTLRDALRATTGGTGGIRRLNRSLDNL